jgi:subtilisin family serine protease
MRFRDRMVGVLLAAGVLAPSALPGGAVATAGDRPVAVWPRVAPYTVAPASGSRPVIVTLITGDKVVVSGPDRAGIEPGPGRQHVTFTASRANGHLRVVPSDALPLLRACRVDERLFDLTALIEFGYDDRRGDLPLMVTGPAAGARSVTAGANGIRGIPGGVAMRVAKADLASAWQGMSAGVRADGTACGGRPSKIWLDGVRKPLLTRSVPQIGAPTAWAAGFDGTGVKVAVIDSGVDADHPDLVGRVVASENFTEGGDPLDRAGHGTHVAATIAGTGGAPGGYKGVAPGASLLVAKACEDWGCLDSSILAGMQWAVEHEAKIVNLSLGHTDTPEQDPIEAAVEQLTARYGTLFVVSAGNERKEGIGSPGSADAALTVGAVDAADALADFSAGGPRLGDSALKPDITAPGVEITAALSSDAAGAPAGQLHVAMSGTSMAAPHVAGAAATLAQQHPTWKAADLKAALMGSAQPNAATAVYDQGAGRVDVARAITQTVTADPASVSFGLEKYPHGDDRPDTRTLTYHNAGTTEVTLDLSLTGDAPTGLFSLSATQVTVPAGATAGVSLTSDTRANVPDGRYGGHVVARTGDVRVVTPFAVDKEIESYDLTIDRLDRAGRPTADASVYVVDLDNGGYLKPDPAESTTLRLRKGRYSVWSVVNDADARSVVIDPLVTLDRTTAVTLDARVARPISLTVPAADAMPVLGAVDLHVAGAGWEFQYTVLDGTFDNLYVGQPDPTERLPELSTMFTGRFKQRPGQDPTAPSPYVYNTVATTAGHAPSGFVRRFTDGEMARVEAAYAGQGVATGNAGAYAHVKDGPVSWATFLPVALPGKRTEYYTMPPAVSWSREFLEGGFIGGGSRQQSPPTRFPTGRTTSERINLAAFGPGFGGINEVARSGDTLLLSPGMVSPAGDWAGNATNFAGRLVLEHAGRVVVDEPSTSVNVTGLPATEAPYTLRVEATRGAPNRLSTTVKGEWTFRSGTTPPGQARPLALSAVRFAPPVSDTNTAPAGRVWTIPVTVQQQPGSAAGKPRTLTVEVSYDDGTTWTGAPVTGSAQNGVVTLKHPARTGYVSLRAASTDTAGNTVKQTIIRAYEIA